MTCPYCRSAATIERPDCTELGYGCFRCRVCKREFNERTGTLFNPLQYPTDVVCLVILERFRFKRSMFSAYPRGAKVDASGSSINQVRGIHGIDPP